MSDALNPSDRKSLVNEHIENYLARVDHAMQQAGVVDTERSHVLENMRSQIIEMLDATGKADPGVNDVEEVISRLDLPEDFAAGYLDSHSAKETGPGDIPPVTPTPGAWAQYPASFSRPVKRKSNGWFIFYAIIFPTVTLLIELVTRICSFSIFDPIPTKFHVICVALVPLVYAVSLACINRVSTHGHRRMLFATGIASGISVIYMIPFIPLLPFSVLGILYMGVGFLPFAPFAAFGGGLSMRKRLNNKLAGAETGFRFGLGVLVGIILISLCSLQNYLVITNISTAIKGTVRQQQSALDRLRWLGAEDTVLNLAYGSERFGLLSARSSAQAFGPWALVMGSDVITGKDAASVYYRLTGKPYNSAPPPKVVQKRFSGRSSAFERDPEFRDGTVGWIDKDLTLKASRIDSIVDAATATGYVEWTMNFHNATDVQREARSQILLPPGGVVSRLTLWVQGEEREAAFSTRAQVKSAYENVVSQRRDPVLVTSSGPDRIMMQCFPVPPGRDMKIRIGITHPLSQKKGSLAFVLPRYIERNFHVPDEVKHSVWLDAKGELKGTLGKFTPVSDSPGVSHLTGEISEDVLDKSGRLYLEKPDNPVQVVRDLREPDSYAIEQFTTTVLSATPSKIIMVVDNSASSEPFIDGLSKACSGLPATAKLQLFLTSDYTGRDSDENDKSQKDLTPNETRHILKNVTCVGGQDNVPALKRAWTAGQNAPGSAVIWIHGPQPVQLVPPDTLFQLIERSKITKPSLYEILLNPGPDRLTSALERYTAIQFIPGMGNMALKELEDMFSAWKNSEPRSEYVRTRRTLLPGETLTTGTAADGHIARLWAFGESMRKFRSDRLPNEAVDLAVKYQLVTPFTGAVVLENKQQYEEAGLKPVSPRTVPTVPEPEEWALIALALTLLGFTVWQQRRGPNRKVA